VNCTSAVRETADRASEILSGLVMVLALTGSPSVATAQVAPVSGGLAESSAWSYSASAYTYFVPDDRDYVQPTFVADRGPLRLEARYNYEDLETVSAWVGWNLSVGHEVALEFTPMLAGVVGNTTGFAAGYEGALRWKRLELVSESEYMFDSGSASDDFFYNWSQLTLAPAEGFQFGIVVQRTRAYASDRELQRGLLVGYSQGIASVSAVIFNPDDDKPAFVLVLDLAF